MRIFKISLIILAAAQLFGQSRSIAISNNDTLTINNFDETIGKFDSLLVKSGDIGEFYKLSRINSDSLISYEKGAIDITLDTIIFRSKDDIRLSVLRQIFKPLVDSKPIIKTTKYFNSIVGSIPFITDSSEIIFGFKGDRKVGAIINVKSNFNNYFSGLIGASRSDDEKWIANGQVDIHVENQWKTASTVDLHWKRLDQESQILQLTYEEPHPLGLPIGVSVTFDQDLRDGNYVNTKSAAGIIKTVPNIGKLGFGGKNTELNSTAKGDSLGFENLITKSLYINSIIDYRNDYWLPTKGYYVSLYGDFGKRIVSDSNTVNISGLIKIEKYLSVRNNNIIALKMIGAGNWINSGILHPGELFRYGGANNLRGYAEDNFKSDWVIIPSVEFNIRFSSSQQITLFSDFAVQEIYKPIPFGYGIGFTQVTKNSVLKLYYGLGRHDSLKEGKIHIQFLTRL
ncbi:MAG: BamA/TamA family outer membrane protein [Candidatus Neomarinimicrobiota bacterium]